MSTGPTAFFSNAAFIAISAPFKANVRRSLSRGLSTATPSSSFAARLGFGRAKPLPLKLVLGAAAFADSAFEAAALATGFVAAVLLLAPAALGFEALLAFAFAGFDDPPAAAARAVAEVCNFTRAGPLAAADLVPGLAAAADREEGRLLLGLEVTRGRGYQTRDPLSIADFRGGLFQLGRCNAPSCFKPGYQDV